MKNYGILLALIIVCIIISILNPKFLSGTNIVNVIRQTSLIGIIAVGLTFVILAADIDLSIGSVAALAGVLTAGFLVNNKMSIFWAVLLPLLICAGLGLLMGVVITKARVHSFVVTLGMLSIARGLALVYTKGYSISGLDPDFRFIGGGYLWIIPMPVVIFIVLLIASYFILAKTPYGRYIYAIGGNTEATRLSGINVDLVRIASFGISGFLAGLGGIVLASRVASGQPTACVGWELDGIAAVIIGGTSLYGGRGGIFKTLIGVFFLGVIRNGLNLLEVSPFYQSIFIGVLIVAAVILDSVRKDN
ncbi:MAG: ribose ABC transporter permease [Clostridiales bacterium GWC2_40_7]|nr:MAG: ribose ABC transporter permease [Clostridiales bacterium GWC2_40_7]